MTDPSLIADLIRAGVDPELVARVSSALVAEALSANVRGQSGQSGGQNVSAGTSADSPQMSADKADKRRAADRERKRKKRELARVLKQSAKTGNAAKCPQMSGGQSADTLNAPIYISKKDTTNKDRKLSKKKRGTRLSADWSPLPAEVDFAFSKGMPHDRIRLEAEKFRNYWIAKPGPTATKLDWSATWRNWVLNSLERAPGNPVSTGPPNGQPAYLTPPPGMESLEESRRKYGGTYAQAIGTEIRIDAGRDEIRSGEPEKLQPPGRSALRVA